MKTSFNIGLTPDMFWAKDIDGNVLKTYRVGKYLVTENLKTTRYNDGTPIPIVEDAEEWKKDTSGAMCYYDNDRKYKEECGALYNFYAVSTGKLAPEGFRVPTDDDWKELEIALGMSKKEVEETGWRGNGIGDKMKEVLDVKFSGYRNAGGGGFYFLGTLALWWSSSVSGSGVWYRALNTGYTSVWRYAYSRSFGFSVRCVRELSESEIRLLDNWAISEEKGNNTEKPQRDEKGRFVKQNKESEMKNEKLQQGTAEPERLSIKERICLKLILLAIKMLRPLSFESQEIEEIKKML